MNFDKLLLGRPNYTPKKILQPLIIQNKAVTYVSQSEHRIENNSKPQIQITIQRKVHHKKNDSNKSQSQSIKKQRVQDAYNSLSDFNDKKQIVASLKTLNSADERIQLIDKILERKDEMMVAQLKLKAVKLEPIFNVIRRKLRKQRLGSATPNNSKKGTLILRQNTTDDFGKILTEPSRDQKDSKEHQLQRQETIMEDQIIEQLQTKVTAGVAFQWLANRHDTKQMAQLETDTSNDRQYLRRATALQYGKNTINRLKQQVSKKVSENSEELIKQGISRLEPKKDRFNPLKIKAKVDSGLQKIQSTLPYPKINVNKRQKTLAFITSERRELKMIGELLSERNTNDQRRRKEANNTELMIV